MPRKPRRDEAGAVAVAPRGGENSLADRLARFAKAAPAPTAVEPPPVEEEPELPEEEETDAAPDETEWEAPLPPAEPEDLAHALAENLNTRSADDADMDRLWDWVRADEDKGKRFLGTVPTTSTQLRTLMARFGAHLFAIDETQASGDIVHAGFCGLHPVIPGSVAGLHLYLNPQVRGRLREFIPKLLRMAQETYMDPASPVVKAFMVDTDDPAIARVYSPFGFKRRFVLTWEPPKVPTVEE